MWDSEPCAFHACTASNFPNLYVNFYVFTLPKHIFLVFFPRELMLLWPLFCKDMCIKASTTHKHGRTVLEGVTGKTMPLSFIYPLFNPALPHVLNSDHTSALCFWALEVTPSKQTKAAQCKNKCQRFTETNTGIVLFGSQSPFWSLSKNTEDCLKTAIE